MSRASAGRDSDSFGWIASWGEGGKFRLWAMNLTTLSKFGGRPRQLERLWIQNHRLISLSVVATMFIPVEVVNLRLCDEFIVSWRSLQTLDSNPLIWFTEHCTGSLTVKRLIAAFGIEEIDAWLAKGDEGIWSIGRL
ncbi:hypothetical protein L218DRAFT_949651 [Marasmius fiardii PR-910]|nr:hypothetical protein L218DRAFT_949651 [Marasmius fiardii PR-910]